MENVFAVNGDVTGAGDTGAVEAGSEDCCVTGAGDTEAVEAGSEYCCATGAGDAGAGDTGSEDWNVENDEESWT